MSFSIVWGGESLGAGAVVEPAAEHLLMFLLMLPEITQLQYISTPVRPSKLVGFRECARLCLRELFFGRKFLGAMRAMKRVCDWARAESSYQLRWPQGQL